MDIFNLTIIELWMNDSTPQKTMNVITDLYPDVGKTGGMTQSVDLLQQMLGSLVESISRKATRGKWMSHTNDRGRVAYIFTYVGCIYLVYYLQVWRNPFPDCMYIVTSDISKC